MKGLSFQNGIEYKISIEGESWPQGDTITVHLESKMPSVLCLHLAEGLDRKVKLKASDAFKLIESHQSDASPLDLKFLLPMNARISDKTGSLYILYGNGSETATEKLGQLRLNIIPHLHIRDLLEVFTAHFRFAMKTTSAGKNDEVEVKLEPSGSKEWASLELLVVKLQIVDESLDAHFSFHRKEVDPSKGRLAAQSVKREFNRSWKLSEIIHDFNQRLNKEVMTAALDTVFAEYANAGWLSQ
jgi:hypothetical protein